MDYKIHLSWTMDMCIINKKNVIVDMIDLIFQDSLAVEPSIIHITDEESLFVKRFDKKILSKLVSENEYAIEYENINDSFSVVTTLMRPRGISLFLSKEQLDIWKKEELVRLVKKAIQSDVSSLYIDCCYTSIAEDMYNNHYINSPRTSFSPGLVWLQYYAHEELQRQGGKEAIKQNPYIQYEEIGEGILVQVGDSPYDAYTKEGEELLVKATKAMPPVVEV